MKNQDKNNESSYIEYLDANNLYGWAMSQTLHTNDFRQVEDLSQFNEDFIKNMMKIIIQDIFLKQMQSIQKNYLIFLKIFDFLPERKKVEKVEKIICSIEGKETYVIHIRALKQVLNHGLKLKKVHRVIQFIQKDWLKPYIGMNTKLRNEAKNDFENNLFKLMNNSVFGKTIGNVRNHRDIKLVTSYKRRKRLVSEPNYHSQKIFSDNLMAIEVKKTIVKMTKSLYLGMPILDISKILMCEFWFDYINRKYGDRAKLCYTDTDSFMIYIKTEDFFEDISNDVER